MENRQKVWLCLSSAVSLIAGFLLVSNDCGAGWFLVSMGIVYLGMMSRAGQGLASADPTTVRQGLTGVTVLFILLTITVGAALQLR